MSLRIDHVSLPPDARRVGFAKWLDMVGTPWEDRGDIASRRLPIDSPAAVKRARLKFVRGSGSRLAPQLGQVVRW